MFGDALNLKSKASSWEMLSLNITEIYPCFGFSFADRLCELGTSLIQENEKDEEKTRCVIGVLFFVSSLTEPLHTGFSAVPTAKKAIPLKLMDNGIIPSELDLSDSEEDTGRLEAQYTTVRS